MNPSILAHLLLYLKCYRKPVSFYAKERCLVALGMVIEDNKSTGNEAVYILLTNTP